jgi:hypothetical protein
VRNGRRRTPTRKKKKGPGVIICFWRATFHPFLLYSELLADGSLFCLFQRVVTLYSRSEGGRDVHKGKRCSMTVWKMATRSDSGKERKAARHRWGWRTTTIYLLLKRKAPLSLVFFWLVCVCVQGESAECVGLQSFFISKNKRNYRGGGEEVYWTHSVNTNRPGFSFPFWSWTCFWMAWEKYIYIYKGK